MCVCVSNPVVPWALESWANYKIEAYTDDTIPDVNAQIANREHAIVTMNHPGDLDWMVGWVLINRVGMLGVSPTLLAQYGYAWMQFV